MAVAPTVDVMEEPEAPEVAPGFTIDPDDLDNAVLSYVRDGHARAEGLMERHHRKWEKYRRLKAGEWVDGNADDPLADQQVYIPKLAEFSDHLRASLLQQLIPNASTMDFARVRATWAGLEEHAERATSVLRNKLRIMRPADCNGFRTATDRLIQDWFDLGNVIGIVTHEQFGGDADNDNILEGPTVERIDPLNWFPWSIQVSSLKETPCTIYAPVTDNDLDEMSYLDTARVREQLNPQESIRTGLNTEQEYSWDEITGPGDLVYKRKVYFGPCPWREIAKTLDRPEMTRADVVGLLAERWEFDAEDGLTAPWWTIEWAENLLWCAKPYPIALPYGCGPLCHDGFHVINGQLLGLGLYDRGSWNERLYNAYHRFILRLGSLAARPPIVARKYALDPDWLAERDGQVSLEPDEIIEVTDATDTKAPYEPLMLNTQAIGLLSNEMDRHDRIMQGETHASQEYRGQGQSKTATAAQNNLERSLVIDQYYVQRWEAGTLRDIVTRIYVVLQQVVSLTGEPQFAPAGYDQQFLQTYAVTPEHLRTLAHFDIELDGSSAPGNRIHQIQEFGAFIDRFMPTGQVNIPESMRIYLDMLQIRGSDKLVMHFDQMELGEMMQNLTAALGAGGVGAMSPQAQMVLAQIAGPEFVQQQLAANMQPMGQPGGGGGNRPGGMGKGRPVSPPAQPGMTGGIGY